MNTLNKKDRMFTDELFMHGGVFTSRYLYSNLLDTSAIRNKRS